MVQNFDLGEFIREQRRTAQISVRQLAKLAGVSNPYLSQIERGLRRPSAEIMQQIAKGLRISAEALYVQAGILDERVVGGVVIDAIIADPTITERQKQVMVEVYDSFRKENMRRDADEAAANRAQASSASASGSAELDDTTGHASAPAGHSASGHNAPSHNTSGHPGSAKNRHRAVGPGHPVAHHDVPLDVAEEIAMSRADDLLNSVQKAVGDRPLQLLVGVGDLVSEKLRELPDAVTTWQEENRDFPMRAAGALIGSAFRANLKVGELYDELTRRGQDVMTKMRGEDVFAEEDEPFVHEPFMPEPVRRLPTKTVAREARRGSRRPRQRARRLRRRPRTRSTPRPR